MPTQTTTYPIAERVPAPRPCNAVSATPRPPRWQQRLSETLLRWLAPCQGPTIQRIVLYTGEERWHVLNPATRTTSVFESEEAVRIWLETVWLNGATQAKPAQPDLPAQVRYWLR